MFRKSFPIVGLIVAALVSGAAHGGSIVGSDHDMTSIGITRQHAGTDFNDYDEVCVYCHTPHGADPSVPLWNRQINQGSYTLYNSATLDASMEQPSLTGITRMCLSCHDGTIAVDSLVNTPNNNFPVAGDHMRMSTDLAADSCNSCHSTADDGVTVDVGPSFVTTDLSDDHPVSFVYDDDLATTDGGLETPSNTPSGLGGFIADDMLINSRIECASCHNVHDPDIFPFLIKDNTGSALCVTCHMK